MLYLIQNIIQFIDKLNEELGRSVAWLTSLLVLVVCTDVFSRYLLSETSNWISDLQWHLFSLIFLLGAGYTFKHNKHVRVDLFHNHFSERDKAWVQLFGGLLLLLPWCVVLIYFSLEFTLISWLIKERSPNPGGLPARYLIKGTIPVGFTLLALQGLSDVLKAALTLFFNNAEKSDR